LAILANVGSPIGVLETREVQATARKLGLEAATSEIRQAEDITPAFDTLKSRAEALYVVRSPLLTTNWIRISSLAAAARLRRCPDFGNTSRRAV